LASEIPQDGNNKGHLHLTSYWSLSDLHTIVERQYIEELYFNQIAHKNKIHPKMAPLGGASFYIGLYREILLNAHSKTTELISTKFGRKHLWGMAIQICKNQGMAPIGVP